VSHYGAIKYGDAKYGDAAQPSTSHGYEWIEEPGSRYIGKSNGQDSSSSFSDFNSDYSAMGEDFTTTSGHPQRTTLAFESADQRTIAAVIEVDNADTGTIFSLATPNKLALRLNAGTLEPTRDGAAETSGNLALPGVSSSAQRYLVAWIMEPNRDTTGASDAALSTVLAFNIDTDTYDQVQWAHAAATVSATARVASLWGDAGSDVFTGTAEALVLSERPWSGAELEIKLLSPPDAPGLTADDAPLPLVPDRGSGIVDDGEMIGPMESMIAAATRPQSLQMAGPALNLRYRSPPDIIDTSTPAAWWRDAPGTNDNNVRMFLPFFCWAPIPAECNRVIVRVRVASLLGTTAAPYVRVISMNRRPQIGGIINEQNPPPQFEQSWSEGQGLGVPGFKMLELGPLVVRRDSLGVGSYFALAFALPSVSKINVESWSVIPVAVRTDGEIINGLTLP